MMNQRKEGRPTEVNGVGVKLTLIEYQLRPQLTPSRCAFVPGISVVL